MTMTVLFICVRTLSTTRTTILKTWRTLITITSNIQYDLEYNYNTYNMAKVDYEYNYYNHLRVPI